MTPVVWFIIGGVVALTGVGITQIVVAGTRSYHDAKRIADSDVDSLILYDLVAYMMPPGPDEDLGERVSQLAAFLDRCPTGDALGWEPVLALAHMAAGYADALGITSDVIRTEVIATRERRSGS